MVFSPLGQAVPATIAVRVYVYEPQTRQTTADADLQVQVPANVAPTLTDRALRHMAVVEWTSPTYAIARFDSQK